MGDVNLTVYAAARDATCDFTTNKTSATSGNNYYLPNDGNTKIVAQLTAASGNIVFDTPGTVDGLAITDKTIALTQNKVVVIGPFPQSYYNDDSGRLKITVSANCDIMAFRG